MNSLIRQFFLKKIHFNSIAPKHIAFAMHHLNHRARKCLGFKTHHKLLCSSQSSKNKLLHFELEPAIQKNYDALKQVNVCSTPINKTADWFYSD